MTSGAPLAYATVALRAGVQRRHPLGFGRERDLADARPARRRARPCPGRPWRPPPPARLRSGRPSRASGRRPRRGRCGRRRPARRPCSSLRQRVGRLDVRAVRAGTTRTARSRRRTPPAVSPATNTRAHGHLVLGQRAGLVRADDRRCCPSVSTAGSRRISAWRFTMRCTPMASEIVTTAGSASGTTATARAMPKMSISMNGCPRNRPRPTMIADDDEGGLGQRSADPVEVLLQRRPAGLDRLEHAGRSCRTRSPCRSRRRRRGRARRSRRCRRRPCSCGRPSARSASASASACFSTGTDSPVSAASSICRLTASTSRTSAGTRSPARSRMTSPGTSVARRDLALLAVAQHGRRRRRHAAQRLDRALGPVLLDEAQQHREQHDDRDRDRLDRRAPGTPRAPSRRAG